MYKWKGEDDNFIVYGFEKKVYAPNYPQKCCCGCNVATSGLIYLR
jgi:hypothetical protein